MIQKKSISSPDWETPKAVIAGGFVFLSGTTAKKPDGGYLAAGDIARQTHIVIDRIEQQLKEVGSSLDHVVKIMAFLDRIENWQIFNTNYLERFRDNRPARTTLQAGGFEEGACLEMDVIAVLAE